MYKNIETERLKIRPITLKDVNFIFELVNSKGWLKFIGNGNIIDKEKAKKYIQKILDNSDFYYSVFELKASKQAIGIITLLNRENQKFPDIGFALLTKYEKNGYTIEASKAYLNELKKLNIYQNIIAITVPTNQKSISLLMKLGLKHHYDKEQENETLSIYSLEPQLKQ